MSAHPKVIAIVKRTGHRPSEPFDASKLIHSIRAACLSVRAPEVEADMTAQAVTDAVIL